MDSAGGINTTEFWRFALEPEANALQYLVIGGLALNFHRIIRNTIDSDVWIKPEKANLNKLKVVLRNMEYEAEDLAFLDDMDLETPFAFGIAGPIDFLTYVHRNFTFDLCYSRAKVEKVEKLFHPCIVPF